MFEEETKTVRRKTVITVGIRKRNKVRKALEAVAFELPGNSYIKPYEKKHTFHSEFTIEVAGDVKFVPRVIILLAALGDVA